MKDFEMWEKFNNKNNNYDTWSFGACNDELVELVLAGDKRATSSLYLLYDLYNEELPKKGNYSILIDSLDNAKCIIKNKNVYLKKFKDIDNNFAYLEGEGDKSLDYWRKVHIEFFNSELKDLNIEFNEDMLVVCEEFEVVYK